MLTRAKFVNLAPSAKPNISTPKPFGSFSHFQAKSNNFTFSAAKHNSIVAFKNEAAKRYTLPLLSQPITTFTPTLITPFTSKSALALQKQQRREAANSPRVVYIERENIWNNNAMIIAALAAIAFGTLLSYAFSSSEDDTQSTYRLRQSLIYLASGLGITAVSAKAFFNSPVFFRLASMNPWASLALTFGGTIATMIATTSIPYENTLAKHTAYVAFNSMIGLSLCPLVALGGPLLLKAAFTTGVVVSALGLTAAASPEGTFLSWGGPLSIGLGVVFASSIGSLIFPASGLLYNICLYGGAGVFGLFVLHDVDKMKINAKYSRHYDPINNSISLYMDIINLFVRIAQMMSGGNRRK